MAGEFPDEVRQTQSALKPVRGEEEDLETVSVVEEAEIKQPARDHHRTQG